ncbi:MAG: SMC-Scp complex subunit ScpB [Verrucomicrobia bacterium]|jgi:segregation and condensation protein B|nr:SMC-Scp complex subunit ScpB [Verrucomicrobiota bacterium]
MPNVDALPGLKQILGALIFGSNRPLTLRELRNCIVEVSESDEAVAVYAEVDNKQLREALDELNRDLERNYTGFALRETAGGYRLQSDAVCGRWLKHLLKAKPHRLSHPALETMAIIAYRQPISKADIESVRGVSVAHIIKALMEMQLVRIVGRSELPGRPFLYGTTHMFLEHFGLKNLKDLDRMAPTVLSRQELKKADAAARVPAEGERLPDEDTMELPFDSPPEAAGSDDAEPEQDSEPEVSEASDAGSEEADTEREDG